MYTYLNKCENVSITIENVKRGVLIKFDGKVTRKYSQDYCALSTDRS